MATVGVGAKKIKALEHFAGPRALLEARRDAHEGRFLDAARTYEHAANRRQAHVVAAARPLVRRMQAEALVKHAQCVIYLADEPSDAIKERALVFLLEAAVVFRESHSRRLVRTAISEARQIMGTMDRVDPDLRMKINGEIEVRPLAYRSTAGGRTVAAGAMDAGLESDAAAFRFGFTQEINIVNGVAVLVSGQSTEQRRSDAEHWPAGRRHHLPFRSEKL